MSQIHLEMVSQNVQETLFVCTVPTLTRFWKIKFDQNYWDICLEVLENFRLKNVSFEVMLSKVNKLKSASFRISKSAVLFQDVETIYDELKDECVVKNIISIPHCFPAAKPLKYELLVIFTASSQPAG